MARLRKEHDSYKASGKWIKNKYPSLYDFVTRNKAKKDTKKWCKGKVGVAHEYELIIPKNESRTIRGFRKIPTCKNCLRQDFRGTVYLNKKTGLYEKSPIWFDEEV